MEANALEKALILASKDLEEVAHGIVLIGRPRKVAREAAAGLLCSPLRFNARRPADGGDIGTGCREVGVKLDGAVGGFAALFFTNTVVASREEEADATGTKLRK